MRFIGVLSLLAAAASLAAAPAFADPAPAAKNPAAKLSLAKPGARAGAPMKRSSNFVFTLPVLLLGVGAAGLAAAAVASSHSDSSPASS